ncbi:MAG: hypothetical protein M1837_000941 [Sclerophora amabilis]|nr:MAG: hypothetical protein M1837_000941 [Sclerophora amabilis]
MHYIRFVKPPKIVSSRTSNGKKIIALITLTSDLGDSFYPARALIKTILTTTGRHGHSDQCKTLTWEAGMRSLQLEFDLNSLDPRQSLQVGVIGQEPERKSDHAYYPTLPPDMVTPIMAARSLPFTPDQHGEAAKKAERQLRLPGGSVLSICEDTGDSIARHVWDAGVMLTAYLSQCAAHQRRVLPILEQLFEAIGRKQLNVIELGSGCGIVGIGLAQAVPNCNVLMTDLAEGEELIRTNLSRMRAAAGSAAEFMVLDWEVELSPLVPRTVFDLIVLADCTYNPSSAAGLVKTLVSLLRMSPKASIVAAMKVRHPSEAVFFDLMLGAGLLQRGHTAIQLPSTIACEEKEAPEKIDVYVFQDQGS